MKKYFLMGLLVCGFSVQAMAEEKVDSSDLMSVDEMEHELANQGWTEDILSEIAQMDQFEDEGFEMLRRGHRIGRRGGVIGRGHRRGGRLVVPPHRGGGHVRPIRPRPPRRPIPPYRPRPPRRPFPPYRPLPPYRPFPPIITPRLICYAENARGQQFTAVGRLPGVVQNRAMNECYAYSRHCYEMGCYNY